MILRRALHEKCVATIAHEPNSINSRPLCEQPFQTTNDHGARTKPHAVYIFTYLETSSFGDLAKPAEQEELDPQKDVFGTICTDHQFAVSKGRLHNGTMITMPLTGETSLRTASWLNLAEHSDRIKDNSKFLKPPLGLRRVIYACTYCLPQHESSLGQSTHEPNLPTLYDTLCRCLLRL